MILAYSPWRPLERCLKGTIKLRAEIACRLSPSARQGKFGTSVQQTRRTLPLRNETRQARRLPISGPSCLRPCCTFTPAGRCKISPALTQIPSWRDNGAAGPGAGYMAKTLVGNIQRCMMTPRERNRLCSERWRRAHAIGRRRPAQRPWLAEGISRSTWYRRRAKAREATARQCALTSVERTFTRAQAFALQLVCDLERCAAAYGAMAAIIGELAA